MSESRSSGASGGVGFCGLLAVAFIVLRLCHVIGWSWWWVLSPLWLPLGVALAVVALAGLALFLDGCFAGRSRRRGGF